MTIKAQSATAQSKQASPSREVLEFYARPGEMTSAGKYAKALRELPDDISSLVEIIQGLVIHQYVAQSMYGVTIPKERLAESHLRYAEQLLDRIFEIDPAPLTQPRPPEKRLVGVCHHHARLLLTMLRAKGMPARARTGFGAYFNPPYFEDHVLVERWSEEARRWLQVDSQFDEPWRKGTKIKHDIFDVPHDQFLNASNAWARAGAGKADPDKFGIIEAHQRGLWFIASSLIRDVAWLNKMELLQWDVWGGMPQPGHKLTQDEIAYFDRLAELMRDPDANLSELRSLYQKDERLRIPDTVFNVVLQRPEKV